MEPEGRGQSLTSAICGIAMAMWAQLFVLGSARQGAELTLVAPAAAPVTAALRLGGGGPAARRHLAHGLQHLRETEALPVVCTHKNR